ncbi:MAG TPA: AraC family transcriptional regulator [Flavisolibacter sp.]|nr:AraC family transcriptional regulator [Flavisolibacter sp.]
MMLPQLHRITSSPDSVKVLFNNKQYFTNPYHFHAELEISLVLKSRGTAFIGDYAGAFEPGDLFIIGANVPHCWRNALALMKDETHQAEMLTFYFSWNFLGSEFYQLPECRHMLHFLEKVKSGIKIPAPHTGEIRSQLLLLRHMKGLARLTSFISVLDALSAVKEYQLLATDKFISTYANGRSSRINNVYCYLLNHFASDISLKKGAAIAHMSETAFSRYFKSKTGTTFTQLLNEIRIRHACQLLVTNDESLTKVAYDCGYNNLSNFTIQFRRIVKQAPNEYRRAHKLYSLEAA